MFDTKYKKFLMQKPSLFLFDWDNTLVGTESDDFSFADNAEPFEGAVDFLKHLKYLNIKTAIISNTDGYFVRERVENEHVKKIHCLSSLFDLIVGQRDIKAIYKVNEPAIKPSINCHRTVDGKTYCVFDKDNEEYCYFTKPSVYVGEALVDYFGGREKNPNVWMIGDARSDIEFAEKCDFLPIGFRNTHAILQQGTLNFNNYYELLHWFVDNIRIKN